MSTGPVALLARHLVDPPVAPSGDEARRLLRRELLHPEYHEANPVQRLLDWLGRLVDRGLGAARETPPLSTVAAMLVLVLLALGLTWLLSRARRSGRTSAVGPVLGAEAVSASELRERAHAALLHERFDEALVDGFRATVLRQVERGRIEDRPGATAREVSEALGQEFPELGADIRRCADLFDLVLYGARPATRDQAVEVLGLDERLGALR